MILQYFFAVFLLLTFSFAQPVPDSTTESLVIVSEGTIENNEETKSEPLPPELKSMQVTSNIRNRYARTVVSSKYANPDEKSQETTFSIVLPDTAFISGFLMEIKGKKYEAYVREKEEAKKEYEQAVAQGLGAAHVAVSARDSNEFTVSVNVEPHSKVIFNLTYEELLVRKHGKYEMVVNLHPGQLVKHLGVDVNINETRPIINVETPALRSGNKIVDKFTKNDYATIEKGDDGVTHVKFYPTVEQQKEMAKELSKEEGNKGISGQFIVEYDVERDPQGGEVLVNDGYFVHFFAPTELKPIPKHVVFVLDVSGSMYGRKIEQVREAMEIILSELNPEDYFSLVKFHTDVQVLNDNNTWEDVEIPQESELPEALAANTKNIKNAQDIVKNMRDEGLTNIYDALIVGLRLTSKGISNVDDSNKHKTQPIIVFLTDGQANVGESRSDKMIEMVEQRNDKNNKAAIFTLAFGDDANKEFLKELGLKNSGFLRNIYEAADASLQLQDFYKQISSPLLTDVNFKYSDDQVKDLTKHKFDILFKGSEFVVAGKIDKPEEKFVSVEAITREGINSFRPIIIPILPKPEAKQEYGSLERLWAYLTIKQLLDKKYEISDSEKNETKVDTPEKKALKLALKYSFVTPVSSLVVVKPNKTDAVPLKDISQSNYAQYDSSFPLIAGGAPMPYGNTGGAFVRPISLLSGTRTKYHAFPMASKPLLLGPPGQPGPYSTTPHFITRFPTTEIFPTTEDIASTDIPAWLQTFINGPGKLAINGKEYEIENKNGTSVELTPCKVESLNLVANCTLLADCPQLYSKLDTVETYKTYFCPLESDRFAGVCCPNSKED